MHLHFISFVGSKLWLPIETSDAEIDNDLAHFESISWLCKPRLCALRAFGKNVDDTGEKGVVITIDSVRG